jgi:serine/tyrosine/threonine adenylyltransferase
MNHGTAPAPFAFDNSYTRLPRHFYAPTAPTPVSAPRLIALNAELSAELGLSAEALAPDAAALFSGNVLPEGAASIAQAYAGHQFGNFVPQLGDGRAILLGEVLDAGGRRRDIQLKGAGPTAFSRRGDGRAALGPVLREYLLSEAMHALGIPTTRSLAAVATGERVYREEPLPGAVLTRVAASHIRVGTFEYFAAKEDHAGVETLARHVMERHYPEAAAADRPFLALLEGVCLRQATLVARWMQVGFIHGVMNTDNMAVSGETIDYGPCAFLDAYDPEKVFSAIDRGGRYAFGNQARVAQWNLARLAETLLPLLDAEPSKAVEVATAVIQRVPEIFQREWLSGMARKIGLETVEEADLALVEGLLEAMRQGEADFTLTFRRLCSAIQDPSADSSVRELFASAGLYDAWAVLWRARLAREGSVPELRAARMRLVNPALIPRNHRVEQAIAAARDGDFGPFERLHRALRRPFVEEPELAEYALAPQPGERVLRTFCGT